MGYDRSKIYKLACDDGHYYYGSTIAELKSRLHGHKDSSKTMTSRVYTHINSIGWDRVQIELVEEFSCANRTEIRMKENEYIATSKDDPLCLNTLPSYASDEQKQQRSANYYETNKATILERNRKYAETHKESVAEIRKEYYEKNKEDLQAKHNEYIAKNADAIKAQRKEFYEQNKKRLCAEKRARRAADPEAAKIKMKDYREKNRERINAQKRKDYKPSEK
jgi:hypothetical protein